MKKYLCLAVSLLTSICFAEPDDVKTPPAVDIAASIEHLTKQIDDIAASATAINAEEQVTEESVMVPISAEDLENLNQAIDEEENVHIVSVEYEKERLKHVKVDVFVDSGKARLSTTYVLEFNGQGLDLAIEDFLDYDEGFKLDLPTTRMDESQYTVDHYAVHCFEKEGVFCSKFERTCQSSYEKPVASGLTSCHAPSGDEFKILQTMHIDNGRFVSSVREGIAANIRSALDQEEQGVSFVIVQAETGPGELLKELFESKLRLYLFNNVLTTLLKPDASNTQEK